VLASLMLVLAGSPRARAQEVAAAPGGIANWFSFAPPEAQPADASDDDAANTQYPPERPRTAEDDDADARRAGAGGQQTVVASLPAPSAPIVRGIEVVGPAGDELTKALRAIRTSVGEPLDPAKQREDIRRLYETGLFKPNISAEAEPLPNGVKLRYLLEPNPKVNAITVSGNQKVDTKKLLAQLPVKAGQVYTIEAQDKIRDSLRRYYEEKGFSSAVVSVEERPAPQNTVDLAITVDEGTKMLVKDLVIRGNKSLSDLPIKLRAQNKGSFGPIKNYYNESKFVSDLEAVKAHYVSKGFLDAEVRRGDFLYAPDQSWVSPVIEITEGPRYSVGRVEARGYTVFSRDEVLKPFRELQGQPYNARKFDEAAKIVQDMYGNEGFLQCAVKPELRKDPSRGMVDVEVEVSEGPRIYVGDVKILAQTYPEDLEMGWLRRFYSRFSPPVRDEVVQREVRLRPGQVYRKFDEVKTRERLRGLNVFEKVEVRDELTPDPCVRDMVVDVTQGNTGNLIFGAGFGDVEGGFVYANYIERNLFGMARDLRVSAMLGTEAINFSIGYLDRYFRGTDIAAQFELFHRRFRRTGGISETRFGAMAEFTRPLDECVKDAIRLRLESVGYDTDDLDDEPDTDISSYLAATVRYRISRDTRDDLFFPTEGNLMSGSIEAGMAGGALLKLEGQYAQYFNLGRGWVIANNTSLGLLPFGADSVGYGERFFLGGSQDMRGFKLYGAGPFDSGNEDIPLGGATKVLSQFELRRAITDNLTGVAFADIGLLGKNPLEIGTPRVSLGTGVRMRLPIARVSLDLGVPVVSEAQDQTQIFHFTITSAF
jgi:outer membrane protein insertion porin family